LAFLRISDDHCHELHDEPVANSYYTLSEKNCPMILIGLFVDDLASNFTLLFSVVCKITLSEGKLTKYIVF
jgi:hypothetical protein